MTTLDSLRNSEARAAKKAARVAASQPDANGTFSHRQVVTILTGLLLGMFLGALDQTIVSTAIRTISDDLHGLSAQAWVTTAYLITSTIATPIYGKLGDLYGRKKLFMFAITVFLIGSALCSFATSMYMLSAFRALQGIGAGGLFTLAFAIIGDIVPPRERAKYSGYFMAVFATSSVLGPVIGGLFAEANTILGITGWRWVFLVNVPIGLVALVVVYRTLNLHHERREARIDWWGAAALVIGLVPLLTVAEQGRTWGWGSNKSIICFVIGAIGLLAFVFAEFRMKEDALIPLRLFTDRAAGVTILASIFVGIAMFGGIMMLPLYMQIVHGASPMRSGFMMLPMVAGMMSAGLFSGQVTARTGKLRGFPIFGTALAAVALFALSRITADTQLWIVMVYMLFLGFGIGNCMQPLILTIQNAVSPQDIGVATSSATFFRQIGGTAGVAVFLSILFSTVGDNIKGAFTREMPGIQAAVKADPSLLQNSYNKAVVTGDSKVMGQVMDDSSIINKMSSVIAHPFKVGFADSMTHVFFIAVFIMIIGFLITLAMPHVELRQTAGAQPAKRHIGDSAPQLNGPGAQMVADGRNLPADDVEDADGSADSGDVTEHGTEHDPEHESAEAHEVPEDYVPRHLKH